MLDSSIPHSHWLSNLSGLSILNIAYNSLRGTISDAFSNLVFLGELDHSYSHYIEGQLPADMESLTKLRKLDLSGNNITCIIPSSFAKLCNLQKLKSNAQWRNWGEITEFVDGLSQCSNSCLESLVLADNGSRGGSIGNFSSLQEPYLTGNKMSRVIPESMGKSSMLSTLDGKVSFTEAHFQNLSQLTILCFSVVSTTLSFVFDVKYDWSPPFNLGIAELENILIGPNFPAWLYNVDNQLSPWT